MGLTVDSAFDIEDWDEGSIIEAMAASGPVYSEDNEVQIDEVQPSAEDA